VTWGGRVGWILRLVKTGAAGGGQSTDVMEINKPDDLGDIAHLGLSLGEAKLLLAALQREIVAAQAIAHAVRRPECRCGGGACHVKDYRAHAIATLFGQVTVRPSVRSRCGCPDFAVPHVVRLRLGSTGHRIADRRRSWINFRLTWPP
jgi:hypothetical protein